MACVKHVKPACSFRGQLSCSTIDIFFSKKGACRDGLPVAYQVNKFRPDTHSPRSKSLEGPRLCTLSAADIFQLFFHAHTLVQQKVSERDWKPDGTACDKNVTPTNYDESVITCYMSYPRFCTRAILTSLWANQVMILDAKPEWKSLEAIVNPRQSRMIAQKLYPQSGSENLRAILPFRYPYNPWSPGLQQSSDIQISLFPGF